ncbi:phage tail spike protein, partial [Pseudolactococcus yaeyamensis]
MQFHILDENFVPVAVMDNDLPDAIHFSKSKFQRFLTGSADFLDFETSKLHVDAALLQVGYWIAFKYNNRDHLLYITQIDEAERDQMMSISSMSLNLDLNLETTLPFSASAAQPFSWYFNQIMYDTGYEIGVNEISNLTRKLSWESEMSHRAFLQSVATQFDNAELDYEVKLNSDFTIKKRLVHVKKKIGEVRDDIELRYGKNVKTIKRSTDISSICTAIRPMSKDANEKITTISSLANWQTLDDNGNVQFFHTKGENFIKAPQANARFGNRGGNVNGGGYIVYNFSHDKISQSELFNRARAYLEEHSVPVINYEVEGRTGANIGDTVKIVDDGYTPQLILSARVLEQIVSFDDATVEAATFGNYKALQSQISADLIAKMQQLAEENAPYKTVTLTTNGLTFKNSAGSTILTARLYKGNKEITPEKFEWMIDGVSLSGSTNKREINANDVEGKAVVRWSALINGQVVAFDEVTIIDVSDGIAGADGRGVVEIKSKWQVTNSSTPPSETWGNAKWQSVLQVPTVTNKYLWQHDRTIFTDDTTSDTITLSAVYGDKGDNGVKGDKGDTGATGSAGVKGNDGTNGTDAWAVFMTNENVTLPANATGGVLSYANSGTSISVMYGIGTAFTPVLSSATLANNQFKVTASSSNITAGTQTVDAANQKINYAATGAMSATSGAVASITYTISIRNNAGVTSTVTKVQNFTKAEKGITGDKGVDSYTYIRYSESSNGASMTSLPNADSQYIGTCTTTQATAPTTEASYAWAKFVGANGSKGDPTGITRLTTEPTTRYTGMLWQYTGTANLAVTGITALPSELYIWTGSAWQLYLVKSTNLLVDNGFITNAMIKDADITNAKIKDLNAAKITAGEILTSRLRPASVNLLRNTEFLEFSNGDVTGWQKRFNSGNPNTNKNTLYYSTANVYGHISLGFAQVADTSLWGDNDWGEMYQEVKAVANTGYVAHIMIRSNTTTKDNTKFSLRVECLNSSGAVISAPTIATAANAPGIINGSQVMSDGYFGNRACLASTSNTAWNTVTGTGEYNLKDTTWRQLAVSFTTPASTTKVRYI